MRVKAGRMTIATLLCAVLASVAVSPAALAQSRGDSGLPSGPGNPVAALQQEISALTQQIDTLSHQVAGLNAQMTSFASQLAALSASGGLGVFDADDKRIGDVVGVQDNIPWVGLTVAGHVVVLQAFPHQLIGQFLWYTGPDCSGTVYISGAVLSRGPSVFSIAAVQEPGGVVYAADAYAQPQRVSVRSVLLHDGTCFTYSGSFSQNAVPAAPLMTLDEVFTRPYSVH